jgi:hypothetical protein
MLSVASWRKVSKSHGAIQTDTTGIDSSTNITRSVTKRAAAPNSINNTCNLVGLTGTFANILAISWLRFKRISWIQKHQLWRFWPLPLNFCNE